MSEAIFKFLNSSPVFISDINLDFICGLCNKVMVNASFIPCACEFCYKCIYDYLQDGHDMCPNSYDECRNSNINISNITSNLVTINKINKLLVKCSTPFCAYQDQVEKVVRHLETCDKIEIKCPLLEYGCQMVEFDEGSLNLQMKNNQEKHLSILINLNKELKTRLSELEMEKVHLDNENRKLKEKLDEFENREKVFEKKIEEMTSEIGEFSIKNDEMQTRFDNFCGIIEEIRSNCEELKNANLEITDKCAELKKENKETIKKYGDLINVNKGINSENEEIRRCLKGFEGKMDLMRKKIGETKMDKECNETKDVMTSPLHWVVQGISQKSKLQDPIWSPEFYSDISGYKMQIGIEFGFEVFFLGRIVMGKNDDDLIWPCRKSIKIKMINQNTGYEFESFNYEFHGSAACKSQNNHTSVERWLTGLLKYDLTSKSVIQDDKINIICEVV